MGKSPLKYRHVERYIIGSDQNGLALRFALLYAYGITRLFSFSLLNERASQRDDVLFGVEKPNRFVLAKPLNWSSFFVVWVAVYI